MIHYQNTKLDPFFSYDLFHIEDMVHSSSDPMDILLEIENFIGKNTNFDQDDLDEVILSDFDPPTPSGSSEAVLQKELCF